eukprot:COSAG01_NODE_34570_length_545_cov_1.152466_1_plen_108_part_10
MTDAGTLSYAVQGAQMATSAKAQIDAADTGDASLSVRGCASCCADWSKHFCSFFSECLTRPQNLVTLFDREHLTNTGYARAHANIPFTCVALPAPLEVQAASLTLMMP